MVLKKLFSILFFIVSVKCFSLEKIWEINIGYRIDNLFYDSGELYAVKCHDVPFRAKYRKEVVNNGVLLIINKNDGAFSKLKLRNDAILFSDFDTNNIIKNGKIFFSSFDNSFFSYSINNGKYTLLKQGGKVKSINDLKTDNVLLFNGSYPFCIEKDLIYYLGDESDEVMTFDFKKKKNDF